MDKDRTNKKKKNPQESDTAIQLTDKEITKKSREADHNSMAGKTPGTNTKKE